MSSSSVHTVPLTLASGNLDQLNDFRGFEGLGTFFISARAGGNDGGGAGAQGGNGGQGTGGGGGGACFGSAEFEAIPLHVFLCITSLLGRFKSMT